MPTPIDHRRGMTERLRGAPGASATAGCLPILVGDRLSHAITGALDCSAFPDRDPGRLRREDRLYGIPKDLPPGHTPPLPPPLPITAKDMRNQMRGHQAQAEEDGRAQGRGAASQLARPVSRWIPPGGGGLRLRWPRRESEPWHPVHRSDSSPGRADRSPPGDRDAGRVPRRRRSTAPPSFRRLAMNQPRSENQELAIHEHRLVETRGRRPRPRDGGGSARAGELRAGAASMVLEASDDLVIGGGIGPRQADGPGGGAAGLGRGGRGPGRRQGLPGRLRRPDDRARHPRPTPPGGSRRRRASRSTAS